MTVKRFSRLFCQLMGFVMFASLSIWSSSTFAACNDVVPNGLVACYPFNGNANDASGKGNNGTLEGGVILTTDRFGNANNAYLFDGIDDYIQIKNSDSLNPKQITISAWYSATKSFAGNGDNVIIHKPYTSHTDAYYQWHLGLAGDLYHNNVGGKFNFSGRVSLPTALPIWAKQVATTEEVIGKWKHITISFDGTTLKVYVNGKLETYLTSPNTSSISSYNTDVFIGKHGNLSRPGIDYTPGIIDDIRVYNRALTEVEVKQLYNEANPESVVCAPANYTNGVLKVPFITIDGVTDAYKATMLQYNSGFAFRVTESAVITSKSSCPATYSPTTGILHIPLVKTKSAIPLNTFQCYDVTMQAFSDRFQLDLETLKVVNCP